LRCCPRNVLVSGYSPFAAPTTFRACCITPPANPIFVSLYPSLILGLALGPGIAEKQWEMPLRLHFLAATGVFRQNNKINAQISSDLFLY
jgi:hypothetical protein